MSTPLNAGLREVKLRYGIRRLGLLIGTDVPAAATGIHYTCARWAEETAAELNRLYPNILHTVEEVELNPED